jgi:hypothetical protein
VVKPLVSLVRLSLLLLPLSSSLAKSKLIGAVGLEVSMVTVAVEAVETLPEILKIQPMYLCKVLKLAQHTWFTVQ